MLCACTPPSTQSLAAKEDAGFQPPRRLWGAFAVAIVCIGFVSWSLSLVYAAAQAGFESTPLPYHGAEGYSSRELISSGGLLVTEQESSGERRSEFRNRKFLRQGPESADDSTEEFYSQAIVQLSAGYNDKVPEFRGSHPNRRMLIPATNVCTNKDISISQGPDGSSGIPRYFVQIVNTCMSDCAPSQVHFSCGWFASALLVNPSTFQRLAYNDCLVNGGKPLKYGEIEPNVSDACFHKEGTSVIHIVNGRNNEVSMVVVAIADECTNKDISITQSRDGSPGMPRFSVQIVNTCVSDCAPADVHVFCGWFASSPPPNPSTFQRLAYNDCLVNGGRPLGRGAIIQFQYANSFMYPIRFRSARFCR